MDFCFEPSPEQKTLLVSILSLISSMNLSTTEKNTLARSLVLAGQTINAEVGFEEQQAAEQQQAREELSRIEKEMTRLTSEMECLKRKLRKR